MPRAMLAHSSSNRGRGGLPELTVVNMVAEQAPSEESGVCLQSRPGLSDREADMGAGPVRSLFKGDGILTPAIYGVSDNTLYRDTTSLGYVGSGAVSWGGFTDKLFVNAGEHIYTHDGTTLSTVVFPDGGRVRAIAVGASRLLAISEGTQTFYWSDSLTSDIDGLSFAAAESSPDNLLDVLFINDEAVLFGTETIEFWPNTGDNELPFRPTEARVIERGIRNTGARCAIGGSFAWVTNENQVCVSSEDNVISDSGLQKRIAASTECTMFRFTIDGDECVAVRLDSETQVYSRRSGMWSEFRSYGLDNWQAMSWAGGVFGGSDGKTLAWSDGHEDDGGEMDRRFLAWLPVNGSGRVVSNVSLRCEVGTTPFLTGDYLNPHIELRQSRDNGKTWGRWMPRSLGEQGQYRQRVDWRACGMASRPGWLAEFRVTDPVSFRVSDVLVNEPYGGR